MTISKETFLSRILDASPEETRVIATAVTDVIFEMLENQKRIATALETLAGCVKQANGYAASEFEVRVYDAS